MQMRLRFGIIFQTGWEGHSFYIQIENLKALKESTLYLYPLYVVPDGWCVQSGQILSQGD